MPRIGVVSDFATGLSPRADPRNVALVRRRHAWWPRLAAQLGWDLALLDLAELEARDALREAAVVWIDQPLLALARYQAAWAGAVRAAPGAEVLQHPEEVEQVYGLHRFYPLLARAGLPVPRTAFVPIDEATAAAIASPQDVRRLLSERLYGALFEAGLDPHQGVFVRGFYSSAKTSNAELFFGRNQAELEATVGELVPHLRGSLELGGLALREYLELERLELPGESGPRSAIRVALEARVTIVGRQVRQVSYHGPFESLAEPYRQTLARELERRADFFRAAGELAERLTALELPAHFVADVARLRDGRLTLLELNPLYASGYNVPFAMAHALAQLGAELAERAGSGRPGPEALVEAAAQLAGAGPGPGAWLWPPG